jgi:outer membrane protein assembly factor BamB
MKNANRTMAAVACGALMTGAACARAQDWPQWRGPNRDAKASDFKAPKTWPKELTRKWKVSVGEGVATPALVGDKLYVFSRQDGNEIARCLDAATGNELWQEKYESLGATGPASGYSGPRSSPAVAGGKVVTLGVRGMLSCLDAATGKKLWRKDEFKAWPNFFPSSSPLILDGLCIAQLGGRTNGAIVAYDLATGDEKWKWSGDSPAYASPAVMEVSGAKLVFAVTERRIVAVNAADGKLAWETPFAVQGMGGYNAASPTVDGQTLFYAGSGRGTKAVKFEKTGDGFTANELWSNAEKSVQFNSPVLKNGLLYGLTQGNELFCIDTKNGQLAWSAPAGPAGGGGPGGPGRPGTPPRPAVPGAQIAAADPPPPAGSGRPPGRPGGPGGPGGPGRPGGPGGPGGRGGGMGGRGGGYGSIVDAGSVLLALTPGSELIVFQPGDKAYTELARIKVAESQTHAHPVVSGNRVFIKDKDSVILWTVE